MVLVKKKQKKRYTQEKQNDRTQPGLVACLCYDIRSGRRTDQAESLVPRDGDRNDC